MDSDLNRTFDCSRDVYTVISYDFDTDIISRVVDSRPLKLMDDIISNEDIARLCFQGHYITI